MNEPPVDQEHEARSGAGGERWPPASPAAAFDGRRRRLATAHPGPVLLASGFARPRNFPLNTYPFRAESHFLYLVGRSMEGAALLLKGGRATLFVELPHPEDELWVGRRPSLDELAVELGLEVRPLRELGAQPEAATLPPQDAETAVWLSGFLDRDVEGGSGDELSERDGALADALIDLRLCHDEVALAQLRFAARITGAAHRRGMAATHPGLREAAVRAAMEAEITGSGTTCAYPPIVTVRGEVLHNDRHDNRLTEGDLVLADVGAETPEGWGADVTRVWPVSGRFTATQRALYEVVLEGQRAAVAAVRPGVRFLEVHRAASRRMVEGLVTLGILRGAPDDLYALGVGAVFFPHGIGHLLGLDVHDMEDLGDRAGYPPGRRRSEAPADRFLRLDRDLRPGMVVTLEPGFYRIERSLAAALGDASFSGAIDREALERFGDVRGIRIEDDVLVTASGCEMLTDAPRKIEAVEEAMTR